MGNKGGQAASRAEQEFACFATQKTLPRSESISTPRRGSKSPRVGFLTPRSQVLADQGTAVNLTRPSDSASLETQKQLLLQTVRELERNIGARATQPLPVLSHARVVAKVLSYFGYKDEIEALVEMLSRKTQKFAKVHRVYLGSFFERWRPLDHALSFGCEQCHWEAYYPRRETLV